MTKNYAARLPEELYEKAKGLADSRGMSFNSFLNSAVSSEVERSEVVTSTSVTRSVHGMNLMASSAVPQNYVFVVPEGSLSDVISTLSKGETSGEEEQEDPEEG